ncbi:MAG: ATP-binding protein [Pseudomonadota bacterium]
MNPGDRPSEPNPLAFLAGGGEMGDLIQSMDWSKTSLGPVARWPQSLRTAVSICLASDLPICVIWGPDLVQLYNDAYRVICGGKHPQSMGQDFSECWKEAWPVIGEAHDRALAGDKAFLETQHIFLERHGFLEECFFTFSFSPIRDETGRVGGLFHPVIEMTSNMLSERRTRTVRDLAAHTSKAKSVSEVLALSAETFAEYDLDLPFVVLYALEPDLEQLRLVGASGLSADALASLRAACSGDARAVWPLEEVVRTGSALAVDDVRQRIARTSAGLIPGLPNGALVLPIIAPGSERPCAIFIAGISPRLPMNEAYRSFYDILASGLTMAVANAGAYEDERRRAKALAELDRAKTAFFSNISHEFRTPLTLMLGPVEHALAGPQESAPMHRERLQVVHRNGLRLLRLVNDLLDFSRIEAGRVRAAYEPTDLAEFTADLASNFRSACERAGLALRVDCPPLREPVFVDRPMWEKIVLNLLSNAFKFTFEGEIVVTLRQADHAAELVVRDTGTGVPAAEMPRLFERFHRVENARGRTHEGSGIGLALVQELVKLHGGTISAESVAGSEGVTEAERGTTFRISIPLGAGHLPSDQVADGRMATHAAAGASPFVQEALRWLPDAAQPDDGAATPPIVRDDPPGRALPSERTGAAAPRVLVADDNADMRRYIERLLDGPYTVETVPDGEAALAAVRQRMPDLILADVMMPRLDGFGLLKALRSDPLTAGVPVILLSARAGEESRVEGMEAGADAYLVKPFSATELLAQLGALLQITRIRQEANELIRASEERFRALVNASSDVTYRMNADWTEMRHLKGREFIADTREPNRSWLLNHIVPDDQALVMAAIDAAIRSKGVFELEHRVVRLDGTPGWTFSRAIPLLDGDGEILEWFGAARDVTPRKRAEHERERLVGQLRAQDVRKDEFLATLAHELRNPLAPIRNGLQVMKLARNDAEAVEQARAMMERQVGHMVRLIDDLLDLSYISQGKLELRRERVEVSAVLRNAAETSHPLIVRMDHTLSLAVPPVPIYLDGDMTRLAQVFSNLLNNAAKYTERGGRIRLTAERQGSDAVVTVEDNGVGIPADMLGKVFEMFTQVDRSLERSKGGLGIGLSLVRRLVELHGGSVQARSDGDGRGSAFVVRLPVVESLDDSRRQQDDAQPVHAPLRRRILVDDNKDAAISLALLLRTMGNETAIAYDGPEALEVAAAFRPDVALLDIGMPKLNGYEVCRRIRQQTWGKTMALFALTGWGQETDRQRSQAAGFDAHLVKPVLPEELKTLLSGVTAAKT